MKKIFAIVLGLIVNVVVILELFLNCATADSTGIPANIMACRSYIIMRCLQQRYFWLV